MKKYQIFLLTLLTLTPTIIFAIKDPDLSKNIQLSGDSLQVNINSGIGQYKGNFIASQGSMRLTGNIVEVRQDQDKQLISIIATGNPVTFKKKIYTTDETIQASANKITYDAKNSKITLVGNASLLSDKGKNIKSAQITYNLINSDFEAIGNQQQRVVILIMQNE